MLGLVSLVLVISKCEEDDNEIAVNGRNAFCKQYSSSD
jgi:hypothetical protein